MRLRGTSPVLALLAVLVPFAHEAIASPQADLLGPGPACGAR